MNRILALLLWAFTGVVFAEAMPAPQIFAPGTISGTPSEDCFSMTPDGTLAVFETVKEAEEQGYEPYRRGPQREIMNAAEIAHACQAISTQIAADSAEPTALVVVGVVSRGAILAMRVCEALAPIMNFRPPCAAVDVYADDPVLRRIDGATDNLCVDGREVVLVDDVINSGWTVQRAMTALWRHGRPAAVKLAVLIDRGHRALPIRPNYIGRSIPTARGERVSVRLAPGDTGDAQKGVDRVVIYSLLEPHVASEQAP